MPDNISFTEAYLAAERLSSLRVLEERSPMQIIKDMHDRAIVEEFLVKLKVEGGDGVKEAREWIRNIRGIQEETNSVKLARAIRRSGQYLPQIAAEDGYGREEDIDEADLVTQPVDDEGRRYTFVSELPARAEMATPEEWCKRLGKRILDPDGWRGSMYRDWYEPITQKEFEWRCMHCTQAFNVKKEIPESDPAPF